MNYWQLLIMLTICRSADLGSTLWITPKLTLESNPFVRGLSRKASLVLNLLLISLFALNQYIAIGFSVASVLLAIGNLRNAWLVQSLGGEEHYRSWLIEIRQASDPRLLIVSSGIHSVSVILLGVIILIAGGFSFTMLAVGSGFLAYALASFFWDAMALRQ